MSLTPEFYDALEAEAARKRAEQAAVEAEVEKRRAPAIDALNALADDIESRQHHA